MTTKDHAAKADHAAEVAQRIAEFIAEIGLEDSYHPEAIVAGAHAGVVSMMVEVLGGAAAAESCERAADRVRHLPSLAAVRLACAQPAGTA